MFILHYRIFTKGLLTVYTIATVFQVHAEILARVGDEKMNRQKSDMGPTGTKYDVEFSASIEPQRVN